MRKILIILALMLLLISSMGMVVSAEEGEDLNWCEDPDVWGDGRCGDEDPWIKSWFWACGWYGANIDAGEIPGPGPEWCPGTVEEALAIVTPKEPTEPEAEADLKIETSVSEGALPELSISAPQLAPPSSYVLVITISNLGPDTATSVVMTPDITVDCEGGFNVTLPYNQASLNSAAIITLKVEFTGDCDVYGTVSVAAAESDPNTGNNTDTFNYPAPGVG